MTDDTRLATNAHNEIKPRLRENGPDNKRHEPHRRRQLYHKLHRIHRFRSAFGVAASGKQAWSGWLEMPRIEALRTPFALIAGRAEQKNWPTRFKSWP